MIMQSDGWNDLIKWWLSDYIDSKNTLPKEIYEHHPLISAAMSVGNVIILVIHVPTMKYIYTSPNFKNWAGWEESDYLNGGVEYSFSLVHPDDQKGVVLFSEPIYAYFKSLPEEKRNSFRAIWDYRLQRNSGEYFKVVQQACALRHHNGVMEEMLVFAYEIENVSQIKSQHLRLTTGDESLLYRFSHATGDLLKITELTQRELEIARLIAKSKTLKEIGTHLNISFNTVKVHSGNILDKLQVNNSLEMINLLRIWGYI